MKNAQLISGLIVLADIIVPIVAVLVIWYLFKRRHSRFVKNAIEALAVLLKDKETFGLVAYSNEMSGFYSELEKVYRELQMKEVNRSETLKIVNSVALNVELAALLDDLLPKLLSATSSSCGAFYVINMATKKLEIKASIGFSKNVYKAFDLSVGEGIIGVSALTRETQILRNIPDDSIYIMRTFLGMIKPKSVMVVPVASEEQVVGVLVLASMYEYTPDQCEIVELMKHYLGMAIGNGVAYEKTKRMTNELMFQNKLIQNLNEDLEQKVNSRTVFLNNIIDSIKDYAIYAMDKNGVVLAWNKGAQFILGYAQEEIIGKHIESIYSEEEVAAGIIQKRINTAAKNGRYEESGWRFKKDGTSYYCELVIFAMYDDMDNLIGFTNVTKDITYLKNVERALGYEKEFTQTIFEGSNQALLLTDQRGIIENANKISLKLLGRDELAGVDLCNFFMESDYLRKNLIDVAQRYGRGEWACVTIKEREKLWFSVNVLMEGGGTNPKLFICIYQ